MNRKLITTLFSLPLFLSMQSLAAADVDPVQLKQEAIGIVKKFGGALKPELKQAIQSGGPAHAISVCAEKAPAIARRLGCRVSHLVNMAIGGAGLTSFMFVQDPKLLIVSMVGVGIAWASILSLPYALLSSNLPSHKMGVYMGIFNFFIVIPQLVAASVLGLIIREFFGQASIFGLVIGGTLMMLSGIAVMFVDREAEPQ